MEVTSEKEYRCLETQSWKRQAWGSLSLSLFLMKNEKQKQTNPTKDISSPSDVIG